jgi:hypothetical protein
LPGEEHEQRDRRGGPVGVQADDLEALFSRTSGRHVEQRVGDEDVGLVEARVEHLTLHQVPRKGAGGAKAEQGHTQQNAKLGGDLQVRQLHGGSPKMGAPHAHGGLIRPTIS